MSDDVKRIKLHFTYVVIILSIIAIYLFAVLLIGHETTITTLSNASLLLSIVLAVIAILITLWDVAGQKNNIATLHVMIDGLRKIIVDFEKISEENGTAINELKDIIVELNGRVILYENKFAQIENLINTSDESKIKKELMQLLDVNVRHGLGGNKLPKSIITADLIILLKMEFKKGETFTFKQFWGLLRKNYDITASRAEAILRSLLENNVIEDANNAPDKGIDYYKLKED